MATNVKKGIFTKEELASCMVKKDNSKWTNATKLDGKKDKTLIAMSILLIQKLKKIYTNTEDIAFVETFKKSTASVISYLSCEHHRKSIKVSCPVDKFTPENDSLLFLVANNCVLCSSEPQKIVKKKSSSTVVQFQPKRGFNHKEKKPTQVEDTAQNFIESLILTAVEAIQKSTELYLNDTQDSVSSLVNLIDDSALIGITVSAAIANQGLKKKDNLEFYKRQRLQIPLNS